MNISAGGAYTWPACARNPLYNSVNPSHYPFYPFYKEEGTFTEWAIRFDKTSKPGKPRHWPGRRPRHAFLTVTRGIRVPSSFHLARHAQLLPQLISERDLHDLTDSVSRRVGVDCTLRLPVWKI